MSFEKPNYDPSSEVKKFFQNNKEELKRETKEALDDGEFEEDSLSFVKSVVGSNIPEEEIFVYKKEVKKLINEIRRETQKEDRESQEIRPQENIKDFEQEDQKQNSEGDKYKKYVSDADEQLKEEERRTGIHPEDYKEK